MASIIIPASKSLTVTNKIPDGNINEGTIIVGCDGINKYYSYLFFDISAIPCNVTIEYAELVLFKTDNFYSDGNKVFEICQLNDYFSIYTTYNNHPGINRIMTQKFFPITSKVAVVVNVTMFVYHWVKCDKANTGIILYGKDNSIITNFGSGICREKYLIPFIKVIYNTSDHNHCCNQPTTKQVTVTGTVAPKSKYEAIIDLEVTRSGSGRKDNYYVVDEYNNLENSNSLFIDKTYNIAVTPKENAGDTETVKFYGSYKE